MTAVSQENIKQRRPYTALHTCLLLWFQITCIYFRHCNTMCICSVPLDVSKPDSWLTVINYWQPESFCMIRETYPINANQWVSSMHCIAWLIVQIWGYQMDAWCRCCVLVAPHQSAWSTQPTLHHQQQRLDRFDCLSIPREWIHHLLVKLADIAVELTRYPGTRNHGH